MKANRAGENYFIEFLQRPVDLYRRTSLHHADLDQLCRIVCVVVDSANALGYEGRQQLRLFISPRSAMNTRGKDDGNLGGLDAVLNQAAHQQVDNARAAGRARGVGHDD